MADVPKLDDPIPPWIKYGFKPAATKKTGKFEDPPWCPPPPRKQGEDDAHYYARMKEERERAPRKRSGGAGGWCFAFPDVCYVPGDPPWPFPFPNIGYLKDAVNCATTVFAEGKPLCNETSEIPNTHWDEMGAVGGVSSGTVAQKLQFIEYSSKVFVENKAVPFHGCKTAHNCNNIIGSFNKPGQKKVWVK